MLKIMAGLLIACSVASAQSTGGKLRADIDAYVAPLLDLDLFGGVIMVARGDTVLAHDAYGFAHVEHAVPMRTDHVFRIASISKPYTRVLVGKLIERGRLTLNDTIARWLPELPWANRVTVRMLLDHRAGVPNINSLHYDEEAITQNTLGMLIDTLAKRALDFEPGKHARYSNGGYAVLAEVIERVTGRSYSEVLHSDIVQPLALRHTQHEADGDIIPLLASGYIPHPLHAGKLMKAPYQQMATKAGGGSLVANATELLEFVRALRGGRLLSRATARELFPLRDGRLFWTGRAPGYNAAVLYDSAADLTGIVLANNYAAGMTADIAEAVVALARGRSPAPLAVHAAPKTSVQVQRYVGTYEMANGPVPQAEVRIVNGQAVIFVSGTAVDVLIPQSRDVMLARNLWSLFQFSSDGDVADSVIVQRLYADQPIVARRVTQQPHWTDRDRAIYAAALQYLSPPRNQLRWLRAAHIDAASLRALAEQAGRGFATPEAIGSGQGGIITLQPLERISPDTARVRVRYQQVSPHYEGEAFELSFLVVRQRDGRWRARKEENR